MYEVRCKKLHIKSLNGKNYTCRKLRTRSQVKKLHLQEATHKEPDGKSYAYRKLRTRSLNGKSYTYRKLRTRSQMRKATHDKLALRGCSLWVVHVFLMCISVAIQLSNKHILLTLSFFGVTIILRKLRRFYIWTNCFQGIRKIPQSLSL